MQKTIPQVPTSRTSTHNRACPSPAGHYHQRKPRIPSFCTSPCSFVLGLTGTKFNRFDLFVNAYSVKKSDQSTTSTTSTGPE
ncbi:hypothetical protein PCANC_23609 [Puccinia coronata f. sp. avenae]|uniref:Uncharacterized protein n=1 Tax=Puccinia coronata f. sp. avenae TaxID=200324 RepID=A0A2N5S8M5_9BASI|nr:hypothetical protein PCANC_23609 [Puccinia coronata f. sp. avenae]